MSLRGPRAVLLLTVFLQLLGFGIVLPLLPYFGRSLGADALAVGWLFAAYSLTQFLLAPFWGALADRVGRRPVLLASIVGAGVAYVLFALATSYEALLVSRVVAGLSAAVIGVSQAYLVDRTPPDDRAAALGMLGAAFGLGFVVGPALGAVLSRWGFAVAGFFAAGLAAVNLALAVRWLPESLPPGSAGRAPPASLRRLGGGGAGVREVLAILFFSTAAFAVLYPVLPLFLESRFGLGPLEAGLLFSALGLVAAVVQGVGLGPLARAAGERPLLTAGAVLMAVGLALLPLGGFFGWIVAAMVPLALGFSVVTPLAQTLLSRLTPDASQAGALSAGHAASSLARACGPLAGGLLFRELGPETPFWAAALMLLVAAALASRIPAGARTPAASARFAGGARLSRR